MPGTRKNFEDIHGIPVKDEMKKDLQFESDSKSSSEPVFVVSEPEDLSLPESSKDAHMISKKKKSRTMKSNHGQALSEKVMVRIDRDVYNLMKLYCFVYIQNTGEPISISDFIRCTINIAINNDKTFKL